MIRNWVDQTVTLSIFKSHVGGRGGEGKEDRERRIYLKYELNSGLFLLIMSQHVYSFISVVSNFLWPHGPHGPEPARLLRQEFWRSSQPRGWTHISYISCIGRRVLYHWATCETLWVSITLQNENLLITIFLLYTELYLRYQSNIETSLVGQRLRVHGLDAGDPGSAPGQGTALHMSQLKIPSAVNKTWCSQINIF